MTRPSLFALGFAWAASCVPLVGDYSEFPISSKSPPSEERTVAPDFIPMVGGKYKGELKGGYPDGRGTFVFSDGTVYTGEFVAGRFDGEGRLTRKNGRTIAGTFDEGDEPESGTLTYVSGDRFEGELSNGTAQGEGTLVRRDGSSHSGTFVNGHAEGVGLSVDAAGNEFWGPFKNGVAEGEGVCSNGGAVSLCEKKGGRDVTADVVAKEVERRTVDELTKDVREALTELDAAAKASEAIHSSEIKSHEARRKRLDGPNHEDPCYCVFFGICGPAIIMSDPEREKQCEGRWAECRAEDELRKAEEKRERRRHELACKAQYAEWLGIKGTPAAQDLASELDEEIARLRGDLDRARAETAAKRRKLEAEEQRRLADTAERARLSAAHRRRVEAERQKRLDEHRKVCEAKRGRGDCPGVDAKTKDERRREKAEREKAERDAREEAAKEAAAKKRAAYLDAMRRGIRLKAGGCPGDKEYWVIGTKPKGELSLCINVTYRATCGTNQGASTGILHNFTGGGSCYADRKKISPKPNCKLEEVTVAVTGVQLCDQF